MASVNEIKRESVLIFKGEPHIVIEFQHVNPGKGSSFVRTRLKNARNGKVLDQTYRAAESVEFAKVCRRLVTMSSGCGEVLFSRERARTAGPVR